MKRRILALLVVVSLVGVGWYISRIREQIRQYGQAERLVTTIWPMAYEMKRFKDEHGRVPASLEEIEAFSKAYDFSPLRAYSPRFSSVGPDYFSLTVNARFGFRIDEAFLPQWIFSGPHPDLLLTNPVRQ